MSDPTLCRFSDAAGVQCICMRVDETYVADDKRTLCCNCGHIASAHPQAPASVTSLLRGFRDAGKLGTPSSSSSTAKASREEAEAEMSSGLRPNKKRKSNGSQAETASKKAKVPAKPEVPKPEGKNVKYGKAVLITCGGSLRNSKAPIPDEIVRMRAANLAVLSTPSSPLVINTSWTNDQVLQELRRLFPEAMRYVEKRHRADVQLVYGVTFYKGTITVTGDTHPTGNELASYCKIPGRSADERVLFVATRTKIPKHHWDWQDSESEDLGTDIETVPSEDIVRPKPKPAYKGKGKGKAKADASSASEDGETDMRKAARARTRLSTGALERKPALFIPGSDDAELAEDGAIVVSDDDEAYLPPAPPLPWKTSPLKFRSPSPAAPISPGSEEPIMSFEDFQYYYPLSPPSASAPVINDTSTSSSSTSNSAPVPVPSTSTSTMAPPPITAQAPAAPAPVPAEASTAAAVTHIVRKHRFQKMGPGRV
ncbi:hypothetical protein C8R46DRAFT_1227238 [Mycena filopes]|nr:hypothetical protein C8R46DRAFT_1227238 [Mycena filopes]